MNKKIIRIMFDIWAGPIWGCYYDENKKEYKKAFILEPVAW